MSIYVGNKPYSPRPTVGTRSEPTVSTATESLEEDVPVVSEQGPESETDIPSSDIPSPADEGGDPMARATFLENEMEALEEFLDSDELYDQIDQLEWIAENGQGTDREQAAALLARIKDAENTYDAYSKEYDEMDGESFGAGGDFDGDGNTNDIDPDMDGDGLTDAFESEIGTNPYSVDTDADGISDFGERWLMKNTYDYSWMDANNADANNNGVVDGLELPESVRKGIPGQSGGSEGITGLDGGTEGANGQSAPVQWHQPASDAQSINAADGDKTISAGDGDVVVNFGGGEATFGKSDKNLTIKTDRGTVTVEGYFDDDGNPTRKLFMEGSLDKINYYNLNPSDLTAVSGDDGFATAGVHFASTMTEALGNGEATYDPFQGGIPGQKVGDEMVYDVNGVTNQTFHVPEVVDGQEVKQIKAKADGSDLIIELKDNAGQTLLTYRLKGGASQFNPSSGATGNKIQLADNGQLFDGTDLELYVVGGDGNDMIKIGGGAAEGKKGSDSLIASYSSSSSSSGVTFAGGEGDDILQGGEKADGLAGEEGMDLVYSGNSEGDLMQGGADSDLIVGQKSDGSYQIDGGGGTDLSNVFNEANPNSVASIEMGPSQGNSVIDFIQEKLGDGSITDDRREKLGEALDHAETGMVEAADSIRDTVLYFLGNELAGKESEFGIETSAPWGGDLPQPPQDSGSEDSEPSSDPEPQA